MTGVPLGNWAQHLRDIADQLEHFQPPMPAIPIYWADTNWDSAFDHGETRDMLRKKYFALCTLAGITDKKVQFEMIEDILGRVSRRQEPITSRSQLTVPELGRLTQALQDWETIQGYSS